MVLKSKKEKDKLKQGWIVKFITPIGNGYTLEYILERERWD